MFRELLVLELAYRRRAGERPTPEEYRRRFPAHVAVDRRRPRRPRRPRLGPVRITPCSSAILALQNELIDRDILLAAFKAWVADKSRPLGQVLLDRGAVTAETHAMLEALARTFLQTHGGKLEDSLAALSSLGSIREDLEALADTDLHASLSRVPRTEGRAGPDDAGPRGREAGASAGGGARFRILRLHKTGGLGVVYLANDEELHREVALKEIQDEHAHDRDSRSRFLQEAEITGRLEHPGDHPGLRPGHLRRRPAVLRDAVHQGGQPQGRHRATSTRPTSRGETRGSGSWRSASCCVGSSTSATRWPTRTAGASCTAT